MNDSKRYLIRKNAFEQWVFAKRAAVIALCANIVSVATGLVSVRGPIQHFFGPATASNIADVCLVIAAIGSTYLSMTHSLYFDGTSRKIMRIIPGVHPSSVEKEVG